MKAILSELGLAFSTNEYIEKYGNEALLKLYKKYTVKTIDRTTKIPQVTKLYNLVKCNNLKIIELPRFTYKAIYSKEQNTARIPISKLDIDLPKHERNENIKYIGKSNPNQQIVVKNIVNDIFGKKALAGATLLMRAGTGKSYAAMDIIGKMKLKTLIVVPNTYLLDQWVTILEQYFPECQIGTLYGKQKKDGDIIVGIINTISDLQQYEMITKKPIPNIGKTLKHTKISELVKVDDILKQVGLTIFDESHMYVSKEFRKVFKRIWSRYTLGLSATPDIREDKLDIIHQLWLGAIVKADDMEGYSLEQDSFISDANMIEYHALNDHCKFNIRDDGMIDYSSIVNAIVNDPHRNNLIIQQTIELMNQGLYTFVFSDRRSHLEHLYDLLESKCRELHNAVNIELPESDKKVILYGGCDGDTIDKAKSISTVIFTTYAYSSTGVSITKMNGLVLSTPRRSNMTQIINRVFRLGSDQSIKRIIIDIVDAKLPIKNQVRERVKAYQERGCEIIKSKVIANESE